MKRKRSIAAETWLEVAVEALETGDADTVAVGADFCDFDLCHEMSANTTKMEPKATKLPKCWFGVRAVEAPIAARKIPIATK